MRKFYIQCYAGWMILNALLGKGILATVKSAQEAEDQEEFESRRIVSSHHSSIVTRFSDSVPSDAFATHQEKDYRILEEFTGEVEIKNHSPNDNLEPEQEDESSEPADTWAQESELHESSEPEEKWEQENELFEITPEVKPKIKITSFNLASQKPRASVPDLLDIFSNAVLQTNAQLTLAISAKRFQYYLEKLRHEITQQKNPESFLLKKIDDHQIQISNPYFIVDPVNGALILKQGVSASTAIEDLLNCSPGECFLDGDTMISLFYYHALFTALKIKSGEIPGKKHFDDLFGSEEKDFPVHQLLWMGKLSILSNPRVLLHSDYLSFIYLSPLQYFIATSNSNQKTMPVAKKKYFKNHKNYLDKHYAGMFQGMPVGTVAQNKDGEDLHFCFGCPSLSTEEDIKKQLTLDYNSPPDLLDTTLAEIAQKTPTGYPEKISIKDIKKIKEESMGFREDRIESLLLDPKNCIAEYKKYLQEENEQLFIARDKLFFQGELAVPLEITSITLAQPLVLKKKHLDLLAKNFNGRLLIDPQSDHMVILTLRYELVFELGKVNFKENKGYKIFEAHTQFSAEDLLMKFDLFSKKDQGPFRLLIDALVAIEENPNKIPIRTL